MPDRLEEIKNAYAVDATTQPDAFKQSHIGWLIAEVERLREARISDLIKEVERLRKERADVIEKLARWYGSVFASPRSELATTEVFREAQQLADRRLRRARNDV